MAQVEVFQVSAFIDGEAGGNSAGVVVDGDRYTDAERQRIAAQTGFPETAFVGSSTSADLRLAFFTPTKPIPHCGHATVASFAQLSALGRIADGEFINETVDGPRRVRVSEGTVFMEQLHPELGPLGEASHQALLEALGIEAADLLPGSAPSLAHNGNGCLLVPLKDEATLAALKPDMDAVASLSEREKLIGLYAFAPKAGERQAAVRMFAPAYGIPEEAATGMMGGPLGYWLGRVKGLLGDRFLLEQGRLMHPPSPSLLEVRLEPAHLWVGGRAKAARRIQVEV